MKTYEDHPFSEVVRRRNRILTAVLLLMVIYMIVVGELGLGDSRMMNRAAEMVSRGIFFGGIIWIAVRIAQNRKMLRDRSLLKEKLLAEKEEMRHAAHEKSGGAVWDAVCICQLFVTLTASLMNMAAFGSACVTLGVLLMAKGIRLLLFWKRGY